MKSFKNVVCIFSNRIDSGVAALLLKNQGYFVTGLLVKNKYESIEVEKQKLEFAEKVCKHLDIPLREVDLPKTQWEVFKNEAISEYQRGLSPDLNILYHKYLTYGSVLDYVRKQVGADALATDNYARIIVGDAPATGFQHFFVSRQEIMEKLVTSGGNHVRLFRGIDSLHDDSFQLCQLPQLSLQRALFPLGDFSKEVVRSVANSTPFLKSPHLMCEDNAVVQPTLFRKDITEVLPYKRASVRLIDSGITVGHVPDIYSIQEGMELSIEGRSFFVVEKKVDELEITAADSQSHSALQHTSLFVEVAAWISRIPLPFLERGTYECRFAHKLKQKLSSCVITMGTHNDNKGRDHIVVSTTQPIIGATRGHYVAFYHGEECLGSAQILNYGPSAFIQARKNENKITKAAD